MEQQRLIKDMAIPLASAKYGDLKHALNASQIFIHKLEKYAGAVQITGTFRYLPTRGTTQIQLLAVGRRHKDLTNKFLSGPRETKLDDFLLHKKTKGIELIGSVVANNRVQYEVEWMNYTFKISNLKSITQLPIAQLITTGPQDFVDWLTSRIVDPHALPWEYTISKPLLLLYKNQKTVKGIKTENDVFEEIGYRFIGLNDRTTGSLAYWTSFKN